MSNEFNASGARALSQRKNDGELLILVPLDPSEVIDGIAVENGLLADDVMLLGDMRETCPACRTVHLKMVLRQPKVKRAHLFCQQCTRCFDGRYADGSPALPD